MATPRGIEEVHLLSSNVKSSTHTVASAHIKLFNVVTPFLKLIRFYLHQNFAIVVFGSLFFGGDHYAAEGGGWNMEQRLMDLLVTYFSFNVCLYGGIYTINAVTDADEDADDRGDSAGWCVDDDVQCGCDTSM